MEKFINGKIVRGVGGNYEILLDTEVSLSDGSVTDRVLCRAKGVFRHEGETPLVGDNVVLRLDSTDSFVIDSINPRRNSLIRPPMANLDILFVMFAAKSPEPVLLTVDKLISIAEHNGIEPVVIVTKSDLDEDAAEGYANIYRRAGFTVFVSGGDKDTEALSEFVKTTLRGKTGAFAGASGIGKSTLLNRLFPELKLETGEISRKISRGRHTTRSVDLYAIDESAQNGFIADTPGFSMLDFERFNFFTNDELIYTFREFDKYIGLCRYTKCTHTKEDGCAIIEAVRSGEISPERHESFTAMRNSLKNKHEWDKK